MTKYYLKEGDEVTGNASGVYRRTFAGNDLVLVGKGFGESKLFFNGQEVLFDEDKRPYVEYE